MHAFANPARFLRIARPLTPVLLLSGLAITAAALVYGLFYAPAEQLQGETVRILFIHVPAADLIARDTAANFHLRGIALDLGPQLQLGQRRLHGRQVGRLHTLP